jgi:putative FmdB family regulatory protein
MPIYEFVCSKCSKEFEKLVLGASSEVSCPECGSSKVERQMSVFGVKSEGRFTSSLGSSCSGCAPSTPSVCSTCR